MDERHGLEQLALGRSLNDDVSDVPIRLGFRKVFGAELAENPAVIEATSIAYAALLGTLHNAVSYLIKSGQVHFAGKKAASVPPLRDNRR